MMTDLQNHETERFWESLIPHLDQAVAALPEADRTAVLLRFYEKKSLADIARQLGISEEAAKKRVGRTVDRLRQRLTRRGVGLGKGVLTALLAEKSVQAAPAIVMASVLQIPVAGVLTATPPLVSAALNAWRRARIKLGVAVGFSAVIFALLWQHTSGHGFWAGPNPLISASQPTWVGQITPSPPANTGPVTVSNAATASGGPQFLVRAISAETGKGIADARVMVNQVVGWDWMRKDDLLTDADGFCAIPLPAGDLGRLDVGVLKEGFWEKSYTWRDGFEEPLPSTHDFKLGRAVTIGGRVEDKAGHPIASAEIGLDFYGTGDATSREPRHEHLGFVAGAVTAVKTDAGGKWHCALAPPGYAEFNVEVQHPDYVEGIFNTKRPDAGRLEGLAMADLLALKAVLVLTPGFEVDGFVFDDEGNPLAGALVSSMGGASYVQGGVNTGPDGSFSIHSLPAGDGQISAWSKDFAPALLPVQIGSNNPVLVYHLNHGASLPVLITDQNGLGIPGAYASLGLPVRHNGEFRVTTGRDGRACFTGIPSNALSGLDLYATVKGYFCVRNARINPAEAEHTVRLQKSLHVTGTVLDADTLRPIDDFKAIPCTGGDSGGYDRSETKAGSWGNYTVGFSESGRPYRVRVEAEGYEPAMSPPLAPVPEEQTQDFRLHRKDARRAIHGTVLLADGRPSAQVRVALLTFERGATLLNGRFLDRDEAILATTDAQGEFTFDSAEQPHTIAAADPDYGFGKLRLHGAAGPFTVQLLPWGRLEGLVMRSGMPVPHQEVSIQSGFITFRPLREGLYFASPRITTDADGRFACDCLPPGDFTLFLSAGIGLPLSHQTVAEIRAGETAQVQIGGTGHVIRGTLALSDGRAVDWKTQLISANLNSNAKRPAVDPPPNPLDFAGRLKLLDFSDQSEEWRAYERSVRWFPLPVAADGTFTVEDVPAGNYQLKVSISDTPATGGLVENLLAGVLRPPSAQLSADVVVPGVVPGLPNLVGEPEDTTPVDLGTLTAEWNQPKQN